MQHVVIRALGKANPTFTIQTNDLSLFFLISSRSFLCHSNLSCMPREICCLDSCRKEASGSFSQFPTPITIKSFWSCFLQNYYEDSDGLLWQLSNQACMLNGAGWRRVVENMNNVKCTVAQHICHSTKCITAAPQAEREKNLTCPPTVHSWKLVLACKPISSQTLLPSPITHCCRLSAAYQMLHSFIPQQVVLHSFKTVFCSLG